MKIRYKCVLICLFKSVSFKHQFHSSEYQHYGTRLRFFIIKKKPCIHYLSFRKIDYVLIQTRKVWFDCTQIVLNPVHCHENSLYLETSMFIWSNYLINVLNISINCTSVHVPIVLMYIYKKNT